MSGFNALTIADALAAAYAPASLSPPTGYPAMRISTARLPNAIPTSPWTLVYLANGTLQIDSSQQVNLEFHVLFHFAKHTGDLARDMAGMLSWLSVLLAATFGATSLGLASSQQVKSALPINFRFAVFTYGGDEYYGWDITLEVILRDLGWTMTP